MTRRLKIPIVTEAEAEESDYAVCCRQADDPGEFTDNLVGQCCACGEAVIFRPYMPARPPKICVQCLIDRLEGLH